MKSDLDDQIFDPEELSPFWAISYSFSLIEAR
jgi:hypothetical protein